MPHTADSKKTVRYSDNEGPAFFQLRHMLKYPDINHAFFTRKGGTGSGQFKSLNTGLKTADNPETVNANREIILKESGGGRLITIDQIHGRKTVVYRGTEIQSAPLATADAVITDQQNAVLMIQTADCQPVLIYDTRKKIIAGIHSGWRGSVLNIISSTIDCMAAEFKSSPADMVAAIGPSLGPCCAEFINYRKELPEKFYKYKDKGNNFNFWEISKDQLLEKGLPQSGIGISNLCTCCNQDLFFSYRRDKVTGRLANIISIANNQI